MSFNPLLFDGMFKNPSPYVRIKCIKEFQNFIIIWTNLLCIFTSTYFVWTGNLYVYFLSFFSFTSPKSVFFIITLLKFVEKNRSTRDWEKRPKLDEGMDNCNEHTSCILFCANMLSFVLWSRSSNLYYHWKCQMSNWSTSDINYKLFDEINSLKLKL